MVKTVTSHSSPPVINVITAYSTSSVQTITESLTTATQFSMKGEGQTTTESPTVKTTTTKTSDTSKPPVVSQCMDDKVFQDASDTGNTADITSGGAAGSTPGGPSQGGSGGSSNPPHDPNGGNNLLEARKCERKLALIQKKLKVLVHKVNIFDRDVQDSSYPTQNSTKQLKIYENEAEK